MAVVEVEALCCCGAPVVADGDYAGGGDVFGSEDLGEGVGLLFVVVKGWVGGFGGAAEAEQVGEQ